MGLSFPLRFLRNLSTDLRLRKPRGPRKDTFLGTPSSLPGSFDLSWLQLVLRRVSEVRIPRLPSGFMETTHVIRERPELCIH